jgi:hypothetical protein
MYLENIDQWRDFVYEIEKTDFEEFLCAVKKFEVELFQAKKLLENPNCTASELNEKGFFST